jgi:hypothetical protein
MEHQQFKDLIALYAFGQADDAEMRTFEAHLATGCDECKAELAEFEEVAADVEYAAPRMDPTSAQRARVLNAIASERPALSGARLVGRESAMSTITERVTRLAKGEGAYLALEGEGGIGKSRLVAELETLASDRGVLVLQGSSSDGGEDLGYQPFIECLQTWIADTADHEYATAASLVAAVDELRADLSQEVVPAIARLLSIRLADEDSTPIAGIEGDALERVIQNSVRDLLGAIASRCALALVFEDLHWADPSTIEMIEAISDLIDTTAILVVGVSRPGHAETSDRIFTHARNEHALRTHRVDIKALSESETRRLVADTLGSDEFPEAVHEFVVAKCEGNPFFTEQAIHSLVDTGTLTREDGRYVLKGELPAEGVGSTAQAAISRRLRALGPNERTVLEAASVAGRYVHRRVLNALVPDETELATALRGLEEKSLLLRKRSRGTSQTKVVTLAVEEGYVFKHALLRDAVYESIDDTTRKDLHRDCAASIEELFADRLHDFYGALAVHHSRADNLETATDYLLRAGSHAATSAASVEALRLFREAHRVYRLAYGSSGPRELEAKLEGNLATALLSTGQLGESIEHFNQALRLHGQWVPESKAGLYTKLAWDVPNVLARLYTDRLIRPRGDLAQADRDVYSLMWGRCRAQNIIDTRRNFFDNFSVFHFCATHGDPELIDHAPGSFAASGAFFAWAGLSFPIAKRFLDVAEEAAQTRPPVDQFLSQAMAFVYHFHIGNWGPENDIDDEMLREGLRHGMLWDADVYLGMRCEREIRQGRFESAERIIGQVAELNDEWGYSFARSNELANAAYLAVERRDLDTALTSLEQWYDSRQEETLHLIALSARAKVETLKGDLSGAETSLGSAAKIIADDTNVMPYYRVVHDSAALRLAVANVQHARESTGGEATGGIDVARSRLKPALRTSTKVFRERAEVLGLAAKLEWLAGQHDAALGRWKEATETARGADMKPELARLARDIGLSLADTPTREFEGTSHEGWLEQAKAGFDDIGLDAELEELEAERRKRRRVA